MAYREDQVSNPPVYFYVAYDDDTGVTTRPPTGYVGRGAIHIGNWDNDVYGFDFYGKQLKTGWMGMAYREDQVSKEDFEDINTKVLEEIYKNTEVDEWLMY